MYVIRELQLNKFTAEPVLSPRALYARLGFSPSSQVSKLTSDCVGDSVSVPCSKMQALSLADKIVSKAYEFERDPDHTTPLGNIDPSKL